MLADSVLTTESTSVRNESVVRWLADSAVTLLFIQ